MLFCQFHFEVLGCKVLPRQWKSNSGLFFAEPSLFLDMSDTKSTPILKESSQASAAFAFEEQGLCNNSSFANVPDYGQWHA